jgi:hypothetical protein
MDETQTLAVQALRELLDNPEREDWDELAAAKPRKCVRVAQANDAKERPNCLNIFAKPDD